MFLSKLFSIFKKKKDNQKEGAPVSSGSASVPPSGVVGGAVGLSQPNQAVNPGADKVAQGSPEPDFPQPDIDAASDAVNPQPVSSPSTETPEQPSGADSAQPQPPAEEPSQPSEPTGPVPTPEEPGNDTTSGDDSQIAV